ncbi:DNA methyltransferase, partial [Treponema sp. UBA7567]|uniref:DNA methyltransferase n=1 Tax=Treponema sp. UBA7567 TaxID=1947748 RepID=UPI0032E3F8E9
MENLRSLFENEYPGKKVLFENLIKPIFVKANDTTLTDEQELSDSDKKQIKSFRIIAQVRGSFPITFADVELQDNVALKRSRVNIQNCVRKVMENDSNALIFFHFSDNKKEWRVSYVNKADSLKNSTSAKRYTYLCGPEHSCRTIAERFSTLEGLSTIKDENMLEAFAVAPLSDDFFNEYRKHYADLVEYISGKRFVKKGGKFVEEKTKKAASEFANAFNGDDKAVRDFVKKLMGRLVFLQFLQKKGWLGVQKNAKWETGDKNFIYNLFKNADSSVKNDFLEQALEPLFFKSLNCDRGEEAFAPKAVCSIYGSEIRIPYLNGGLFEEDELDKKKVKFKKEHFESIFEFFNQYNFTIDETDPDDVEIGVDPEMLGKIFENLLEDNKDKGAFYTPKEIVQYMCRESLIAYLETEAVKTDEAAKDKIRNFVLNHDASSFSEKEKADILKALIDVKICDPAVGSGAFPMGMLNELLPCAQILVEEAKTRVELKKHIVKNNIYGVDIEKGAVDIARLRFWLAIIVDEEEPLPLPNLDYKIMQGNSLLESFEGIDLSDLTTKKADELFDDADDVKCLVTTLQKYFDTSDHNAKTAHKEAIKSAVLDLLEKRGISTAENKAKTELKKLDLHENSQFFLWHTWFYDVFNRP